MNYLYHMAPKNMQGNILMPLNILHGVYPDIYNEAIKKYGGRKDLLKRKIPILDCLWNDCLHFTAVHPSRIVRALKISGSPPRKKIKWFKISPNSLNKNNLVVYLYQNLPNKYLEDEFIPFDHTKISDYIKIPKETIKYYKTTFENKRIPLLFHLIPHILYKGEIDISEVEVIEA